VVGGLWCREGGGGGGGVQVRENIRNGELQNLHFFDNDYNKQTDKNK